ncbi:unnamed protein product [Ectocarpus sp. 8 AP-2014]
MGRAATLGGNAWDKEIIELDVGPRPFPIVVLSSWFLVDHGRTTIPGEVGERHISR